jgi:hypothetical protein
MTKNKIVLKKLKRDGEDDTIWHPESRLVFKSKKDKLVVGRLNEDDDMAVDETVIDLCSKWKFKIDPSLVESASEDEVEEEVVESAINRNIDSPSPEKDSEAAHKHSKDDLLENVKLYCVSMDEQIDTLRTEVKELKHKLAAEKERREEVEADLSKAKAKLAKIREHFS